MGIPLEDLKAGVVVRLMSGSPKMGVVGVRDGGMVECLWWSDQLGMCSDQIPAELLTWPRKEGEARPGVVTASEGDDA